MITTTMTAREVVRIVNNDYDHVFALVKGRMRGKVKELCKKKGKTGVFRWTSYESHQPYLVGVHGLRDDVAVSLMAVVESGRVPQYYMAWPGGIDRVCIYTHHFVMRYKERTGTALEGDELICSAVSGTILNTLLWESEDRTRSVYMRPEGLELIRTDGQFDKACTFVSRDMLGESQRKAYDATEHILYAAMDDGYTRGLAGSYEMSGERISHRDVSILKWANDIYGSYFEQYNDGQ